MDIHVRPARRADLESIQAIYAHHVRHGFGTFEETPPPVTEMQARYQRLVDAGFPFLVATDSAQGRVVGYAYASEFRARVAYRYTCEDSVYIAHDAQRRGVGRALLASLIPLCEAVGFREMLAVIGDSANAGSIGLHTALGFEHAGVIRNVGCKFGRDVDVVFMQKRLSPARDAGQTPVERLGGH